jgi:hypothetical protein
MQWCQVTHFGDADSSSLELQQLSAAVSVVIWLASALVTISAGTHATIAASPQQLAIAVHFESNAGCTIVR